MMEQPNLIKRPILVRGSQVMLRLRQGRLREAVIAPRCMTRSHAIRIGTSGWSYPSGEGTWNGIFYPRQPARRPRGAPKFDELAFYAEHFDTVEVNSTFYRVPAVADGRRSGPSARPPDSSSRSSCIRSSRTRRCSPKATGARPVRRSARRTSTSSAPRSSRSPTPASSARCSRSSPRASRTTTNRAATSNGCSKAFREYPVAVELRHRSWSDDADEHRARCWADSRRRWAQIDEPKFKSSIRQTLLPERADVLLPAPARPQRRAVVEAREVGGSLQLPLLARRSWSRSPKRRRDASRAVKKAYLYANNHFSAKSVANAAILKAQLGQELDGEYPAEFVERYPDLKGIVKLAAGAADAHGFTEAFLSMSAFSILCDHVEPLGRPGRRSCTCRRAPGVAVIVM